MKAGFIISRGSPAEPQFSQRAAPFPGTQSNISTAMISRSRHPSSVQDMPLSMTSGDCATANLNPREYLLPFFRDYLDDIAHMLIGNALRLGDCKQSMDAETIRDVVTQTSELTSDLESFRLELRCHLEASNSSVSPAIERMFKDIDVLREHSARSSQSIRDLVSVQVGLASLEESKKSMEQAKSTKRISQLAYVYLPLAFGSSLFGMNIAQFENAKLSSYVSTTIVLLTVTLLFYFIISPVQRIFQWYYMKDPSILPTLARIRVRLPLCSMIMYSYLLFYGSEQTSTFMKSVQTYQVFWTEMGYSYNHEDYMSHIQTVATHIKGTYPILAWLWMPCARYIHSHIERYCTKRSQAP